MSTAHPRSREIEALYSDHHGWLHAWLRGKLGNSFDAADLAQDTFARVLAGRMPASLVEPRAYLTTVAKGILVNWYRRQALERAYLEALAALPEPQAPAPEQRVLILETLYEIDALLDRLPPQVRRTFLLSQIEGMKYDDIARATGLALVTVKRHMKQAFSHCLAAIE